MKSSNTPQDSELHWRRELEEGERIEVLNNGIRVVEKTDERPGCGTEEVTEGDVYSIFADAVVLPDGQMTWYYRGPPGATVTISLTRVANTGGHSHSNSGTGPAGSVTPSSFVLGPNYPQNQQVVVRAAAASGTLLLTSRFSAGSPSVLTSNIYVRVPGLAGFGGGKGITLTGATQTHPTNHFGLPALNNMVAQLGAKFYDKFNKNIFVNDMSLAEGGLFDHKATWAPPHQTHRDGRRVDINSTSMDDEQRLFFETTAKSIGFRAVVLETNPPHWHLEI